MDWTGPLESRTTYCRGRGLLEILCSGGSLEVAPSRVPGWITLRCHTQVLSELPRDPWSSDFTLNITLWKKYCWANVWEEDGNISSSTSSWRASAEWTRWKQRRANFRTANGIFSSQCNGKQIWIMRKTGGERPFGVFTESHQFCRVQASLRYMTDLWLTYDWYRNDIWCWCWSYTLRSVQSSPGRSFL